VAGHETAAGIVKYTLHALSKDQERQEKLRTELSAAGFGASCGMDGKEPTYDELTDSKTLPYLDAVAKEAYVTPIFCIGFELVTDGKLSLGDPCSVAYLALREQTANVRDNSIYGAYCNGR